MLPFVQGLILGILSAILLIVISNVERGARARAKLRKVAERCSDLTDGATDTAFVAADQMLDAATVRFSQAVAEFKREAADEESRLTQALAKAKRTGRFEE